MEDTFLDKPILSVIIPCYNEQESIPLFYKEIKRVADIMEDVLFEVMFIDDGSKDDTLNTIKKISRQDQRVQYISFSRNFGKEAAIYAGLESVTGEYVALIDADLQHPPDKLIEMYKGIVQEGYDCVAARRTTREGEPLIRSFFSRTFYCIVNKISDTAIVDGAQDFRLMTRSVVDAILDIKEYNRFTKGIFSWVGFRVKWLEYRNVERAAGETKWSFWKLLTYSFEGIVAFSTAPLRLASLLGVLFFLVAVIGTVIVIIKTVLYGDPVAGWPTLICVLLMVGGAQLFCIGILGEYLAKTYMETKRRPIYIAKESLINKRSK